jgi:hypothetical protein
MAKIMMGEDRVNFTRIHPVKLALMSPATFIKIKSDAACTCLFLAISPVTAESAGLALYLAESGH